MTDPMTSPEPDPTPPVTPASGTPDGTTANPLNPSATPANTAQVLEASRAMLFGGLWPAVAVAVLAAVVAGLLAGTTGVVAAIVGAVVVIAVCSLGPLVMRWTAAADPMVVMAAALVSMMGKLGLLLVVFLVLQAPRRRRHAHRRARARPDGAGVHRRRGDRLRAAEDADDRGVTVRPDGRPLLGGVASDGP